MGKIRDLIEDEINNMLPHTAYKFVYEKMPKDAIETIEKAFSLGMNPEDIGNHFAKRYPMLESKKKFFIKALEHHKFLIEVRKG